MQFAEFNDLVRRIFLFLGSEVPGEDQQKEWFNDVRNVPSGAVKQIWENLKQRDGISKRTNVPKVINEIYAKISTGSGGEIGPVVAYDPIEDFRFPVGLMHKALAMLQSSGETAFVYFCDSVKMPLNDRERVRCKAAAIAAADGVEIQTGKPFENMATAVRSAPNPQKLLDEIPF